METKKKLGQRPYFGNIGQSSEMEYSGTTERRKIAADVLCALLSNSKSMEMVTKVIGVAEPEKVHELMIKTSLCITDRFLKLESE